MASVEELQSNFNFISVNPSEFVLKKCVELCSKYDITAEELVDQWSAFTASKLNGSPPTVDTLELMERKELMKQGQENIQARKTLDVKLPDPETLSKSHDPGTPKAVKRVRSPDSLQDSKRFLPSTSSDSTTSTSALSSLFDTYSFTERTEPFNVVLTTGSLNTCDKDGSDISELSVRQWGPQETWLSSETRYMYEVMRARASSINSITQQLGMALIKKYNLDQPEGIFKNSGSVTTFGRICCEADAKLNSASIQLESTWELTHGYKINLNVSKLSSYALFPGQVVAVQGTIITNNTLVVQKLYTDATLNLPIDPVDFQGTLDIIVAAGPFTLYNNLSFEPLQELLKYAVQKKPHILILIGPFLDASHEKINDETLLESFTSFFDSIVEGIMSTFKGQHTQVVMVSSQKDAHHHPVYPTPPYISRHKFPNLHFVPDPSMLSIGGLVVGVTGTDILFHLSKEEITAGPMQSDRMSRLISHLLEQNNFYPLNPPNSETVVDMELIEKHCIMEVTPHLLILPSSLRYFAKEVRGSLVLNPERLVKGYVAGTFAHLQVAAPIMGSIFSRTKCDIIRI